MNRITILMSLIVAAIIVPTLTYAQAYNETGNYLRLPTGYQQQVAMRPAYNGQGMGQGQLQGQTMHQPQSAMQPQAVAPTSVSSRMLPPEMVQQGMQPSAMVQAPQMAAPSSLQPMATQPMAQTMQPQLMPAAQHAQITESPQAAVQPVVMSHMNGVAGSSPVSNTILMGEQSNVELRPACDVPDNHRAANKGLNTSTTIHGDCLN